MKLYSIDEIRAALADRVITTVAERTGIHSGTLYNICKHRQKAMNLSTYQTLVRYLFGEEEAGA